jgi:hypothetical protein
MPAMTTTADPREEDHGLSLTELMMLPVILLWLTFQAFAQQVVKLKELRRTRPMPINWQAHWANLRLAEWHIRELTASGIEQIVSGKELDLRQLVMDIDPPEEFGQMPASALEMHRRFEAIARFHADPERHIRRAAQRIAARDGEPDPLGRLDPRSPPLPPPLVVVVVVVVSSVFSATSSSAQRIRAPPWPGANSKKCTHIASLIPSARSRAFARNTKPADRSAGSAVVFFLQPTSLRGRAPCIPPRPSRAGS